MPKVFDSSAVLALLQAETGAVLVQAELPGSVISAVNVAEVLDVLVRKGLSLDSARTVFQKTWLTVQDFTELHAAKTAELQSVELRSRGISFGDRACMATAILLDLPVLTADRMWGSLKVPRLRVQLIRC